jgi:transcriptional regulator of acetoin/glycerol metabolism
METFPSDAYSGWGVDGLVAEQVSSLIRVAPEDFTVSVENALQRIGNRLNIDLAVLLEHAEDRTQVESEYHWVRPTVPPVDRADDIKALVAVSQSLADSERPMVLERIPEQLPFARLTESALDDVHRTTLKSAVIVPVAARQRILTLAVGVFSDYRSWPEPLIDGLRLLAEILSAASLHRRQELGLRQSTAELARLSARSHPIAPSGQSDDEVAERTAGADQRHSLPRAETTGTCASPSDDIGATARRCARRSPGSKRRDRYSRCAAGRDRTGKELSPLVLHVCSPCRLFPLVSVNCARCRRCSSRASCSVTSAARSRGAVAQRQVGSSSPIAGRCSSTKSAISPDLQSKSLRVLQEGEFERLGSSRTCRVNVRVVAATHRDLHEAVADGSFQRTFTVSNVFPVRLPLLRERLEDIEAPSQYFVSKTSARDASPDRARPCQRDRRAQEALLAGQYP